MLVSANKGGAALSLIKREELPLFKFEGCFYVAHQNNVRTFRLDNFGLPYRV